MTAFRILLGVLGLGLAAYGINLLLQMNTTDLKSIATWFIGGILAENLIYGPAAALIGLLGHHLLPARWWKAAAIGAICTLTLLLLAVPVLGRADAVPGNHTILDRNYPAGLALSLLTVWAAVIVYLFATRPHPVASHRAPAPAEPTPRDTPAAGPVTAAPEEDSAAIAPPGAAPAPPQPAEPSGPQRE
ncbi:hypothetical protein ACIP5Y_39920 [Nocardia sp. NPDC088792]|uniref:hypothetical protein n=1 Tax=Nocardia sp. NPDC088792 TaxID=3364332 RepID=UPI0037F6438C